MTNSELAVLGLVAEEPGHAYRLESQVEVRGMREWTEIGFSSIYYVLNKLERAGWLASRHSLEGSGPARRVYRLTEAGWNVFRMAVRERLANPRPRTGDFHLALANLPALATEEVRLALETRQNELDRQAARLREKLAQDCASYEESGQAFPDHVASLFDYSLAALTAERDWVTGYLEKIEVNKYG